jgi:hypothetical protein
MRRVVVAVLVAVAQPVIAGPVQMQLKQGTTPSTGVETVAAVGNPVFERFKYVAAPAYEITEPVVAQIIFAHVDIPAGAKLLPIASGTKLKACYVLSAEAYIRKAYSGCLMDDDGDGTFDRVAGNEVQGGKKLPSPVPYHATDVALATSTQNFKQVVTYLGAANGTLHLSYREFMNDFARPAFTEEYTFPLGSSYPQPIAFKDVKLTVLGIDGAGIRYRVEP